MKILTFKGTLLSHTLVKGMALVEGNNRDNRDRKPEFRAESFIGQMHYWFRALHQDITVADMLSKEQAIFGSIDTRSTFDLGCQLIETKIEKTPMLPHKDKLFKKEAYSLGQNFTITLTIHQPDLAEKIKAILMIASLLGSIGNRSRRGFGSYQIESCDIQKVSFFDTNLGTVSNERYVYTSVQDFWAAVEQYAKIVNPYFKFNDVKGKLMTHTYDREKSNHPFIKGIQLSPNTNEDAMSLVRKINKVSHDVNDKYKDKYKWAMGGISQRQASPVIVSLVKINNQFHAVSVELNLDGGGGNTQTMKEIRKTFTEQIQNIKA